MPTSENLDVVKAYEQFIESDHRVKEEFVGWLKHSIEVNSYFFKRAEDMGPVSIASCLARGAALEEVLKWFTTVFIKEESYGNI